MPVERAKDQLSKFKKTLAAPVFTGAEKHAQEILKT